MVCAGARETESPRRSHVRAPCRRAAPRARTPRARHMLDVRFWEKSTRCNCPRWGRYTYSNYFWQHGWRAHSMHMRTRQRDTSPHIRGGHSLASCMVRGPETVSRAHAALVMRGTRLGLRNQLHTEGNGTHPCMRLGHTTRPHAHHAAPPRTPGRRLPIHHRSRSGHVSCGHVSLSLSTSNASPSRIYPVASATLTAATRTTAALTIGSREQSQHTAAALAGSRAAPRLRNACCRRGHAAARLPPRPPAL